MKYKNLWQKPVRYLIQKRIKNCHSPNNYGFMAVFFYFGFPASVLERPRGSFFIFSCKRAGHRTGSFLLYFYCSTLYPASKEVSSVVVTSSPPVIASTILSKVVKLIRLPSASTANSAKNCSATANCSASVSWS